MEKVSDANMSEFEREIGMTREEDVKTLRNWINCQPHLPDLKDDEETAHWLRNFLFFCKNRPEKAKRNLEHYFSSRSLVPELFGSRDPADEAIAASVKNLYLFPLPRLTPDGCRVHLFSHAVADASAYDADAFMRRALMFLDWKIKEDVTCGDIFIFHMKYSSLAHLGKYNFATLSRFIATVINAYPLRIKSVHFTAAPSFVSYIISNPFITDKIKKRIKVHAGDNFKDLLTEIPARCLPKELGGTIEDSLEALNDAQYGRLLALRDWYLSTRDWKSDEGKRPPELKTNDLFGCDGSFRSLNVD
ncbi:UNVERIFIED_CONTAM: hypothetical protein PYX00_005931 [Menopon gallinae]|uniref:CRAL-TRIO domain-containing protein n=1 Tax=Menopon gallinae TaxID=328185 RepID=A0AAW2HT52_9NEOP